MLPASLAATELPSVDERSQVELKPCRRRDCCWRCWGERLVEEAAKMMCVNKKGDGMLNQTLGTYRTFRQI